MRVGYGTITRILPHPKDGYKKIEGFFVYPLNCARVSVTFAKVIPPDPLPDEVGERFEFSWIVPKDRPWKVGDRLAGRPTHRAVRVQVGTRTRTRGSLLRRLCSTPPPQHVERSYLPARRFPADVAAHRVLVCTAGVKGALDRCPGVRANAIRLGWFPGSACSFAMSDHPLRVPLPA